MVHARVAATVVAALLLAGCAKPQESQGPDGEDVQVRVGNITSPAPDVQVGPNAASFTVNGTLVRIELHHAVPGEWSLGLVDEDGQAAEGVFSGTGPYDGARWLALADGAYDMRFEGGDAWSATVRTDLAERAPPVTWEGDGDDGTTGVRLERESATFNVTSEGPFHAWLVAPGGRTVVTLANTDNATSDWMRITVREAGVYVVNVEAEGPWTIRVEQ